MCCSNCLENHMSHVDDVISRGQLTQHQCLMETFETRSNLSVYFHSCVQSTTSLDLSNSRCLMPNVSKTCMCVCVWLPLSVYQHTLTLMYNDIVCVCQPPLRQSLGCWSLTAGWRPWRCWRFWTTTRSGFPVSVIPVIPDTMSIDSLSCSPNSGVTVWWNNRHFKRLTLCSVLVVPDGSNPYTLKLCFSTSSHLWRRCWS